MPRIGPKYQISSVNLLIFPALIQVIALSSCGSGKSSAPNDTVKKRTCSSLSGSAWVPQVSAASSSNHDSNVTLSQVVVDTTGPITGLAQGYSGREISISIDMSSDLGASGSLTLTAQTTSYPGSLQGNAFAYLVSLNDGTNELVNLSSSCASSGFYSCSGSTCSVNSSCTVSSPSAFMSRDNWEQHQGYSSSAKNYPSINIFPTCNWSGGTLMSQTSPGCAFNQTFFSSGKLRSGTTYTAKYILLADSYSSLSGYTAGLRVTAVKKTSTRSSPGGAVDLNLILVGSNNIKASRTAKGQQNLNTLVNQVAGFFSHANMNLKLGTVKAVEFSCESGGDEFSNVYMSDLGSLLSSSSRIISSDLETKAMNIFLVSSIKDDSSSGDSNLTILGVDGAIGGPIKNGTAVSGLAVSTFDMLDKFNSSCASSSTTCSLSEQDSSFFELTQTVAHEAGHYFGLNHLSEAKGTAHDFILDTPVCTATDTISGKEYVTINSCLNKDTNVFSGTGNTCKNGCASYNSSTGAFCPTATACQFNYIMWWTTKNFKSGSSDGTLFSSQEGAVVNYHPLAQ